MLTKPDCGWTTVTLGNFTDRASYLTNVPDELLHALIYGIETYNPASVQFDAEGWDYTITFRPLETYIVRIKEEPELFVIDAGIYEIAREVLTDIERDLDAWMEWNTDDYCENLSSLSKKISRLKWLISLTEQPNDINDGKQERREIKFHNGSSIITIASEESSRGQNSNAWYT